MLRATHTRANACNVVAQPELEVKKLVEGNCVASYLKEDSVMDVFASN